MRRFHLRRCGVVELLDFVLVKKLAQTEDGSLFISATGGICAGAGAKCECWRAHDKDE